jgi:hypothetical protein
MVLMLNKSLKLAASIVNLHTTLLRPSTNFGTVLPSILHSLHLINNVREDACQLTQIFMPKDYHLRQLVNQTYQITPSWTPSSCMPEESDYSLHAPTH